MRISIAEAEGQLTELVKLATQGEEVVLTQDGGASVRLEPISRSPLPTEERLKLFEKIRQSAKDDPPDFGTDAARSQDFLYDEFGLPK
ncbi:type II toxin-antitoxin system prevent-host-death family antitoxin [Neorhizobium sp. SOG26]|uniref:type II toxin-antitoxin system Phd/YefM family antitoxin n=1 Tax=Neorhizobium sp. SOG26 TaxID=2060726 RepID=UPI000E56A392|nr:type II toxin-antitoxin system prevent-host-death family antitoxin [Neorhizobium sp. SOG26]AXV16227.1 type II toxin-antitoxin system prevent-host-death family antitoxin [Neorhizobium sp. SOG26]